MAKNVTVVISGGQPQVVNDLSTVAKIKERFGKMNYIAKINGAASEDEDELEDYAFVTLAENVKGGR